MKAPFNCAYIRHILTIQAAAEDDTASLACSFATQVFDVSSGQITAGMQGGLLGEHVGLLAPQGSTHTELYLLKLKNVCNVHSTVWYDGMWCWSVHFGFPGVTIRNVAPIAARNTAPNRVQAILRLKADLQEHIQAGRLPAAFDLIDVSGLEPEDDLYYAPSTAPPVEPLPAAPTDQQTHAEGDKILQGVLSLLARLNSHKPAVDRPTDAKVVPLRPRIALLPNQDVFDDGE